MGDIIVSGAALRKAGAGVSTSIPASAWIEWISGAESYINDETRTNWSSIFASNTDAEFKSIVADTAASLVAINAIQYDMSGYTSILEATTMLDVNTDIVKRNIGILKDSKNKSFIGVEN